MKKKIVLLLGLLIAFIPFVKADTNTCHAELESNQTFNVGETVTYNLGTTGTDQNTLYGIHYEIEYDPNVLDPEINSGVKSYYNWENIRKEIVSNDNSKYNTIILDISTKNKNKYITSSDNKNSFIKVASISFKVKNTNETSTKLSLMASGDNDSGSFKYVISDGENAYSECSGQINSFVKIKKIVEPVLSSITINGTKIEDFDGKKYEYEYTSTEKTIDIRGIGVSGTTVTNIGKKELKDGDNEFIITVSNSEGDSVDYRLIVKYDSTDDDCDIKTLAIDGYDIKFDPNILEYKLKIKDEYSLKFNIELVNTESKYTIKGNQNLQNESNIIIEVRNGAKTKKYTITIEKEVTQVVKKKTSPLLIVGLVVLGLGIIGLIVFLIIKNKKKKNKEEDLEKTKDLTNVLDDDTEEDEDIDEDTDESDEEEIDEESDEIDDDSSLEDDFDLSDK